ncbi:MAG: hypothetical protein J5505_02235 [Spirochaetaceae bacterium]|nr:hypothetical protein [Spirochaetaceae bacterium]
MDGKILGQKIAEILVAPNASPEARQIVEEMWTKVGCAIMDCVEAYVEEKLKEKAEGGH